MGPVEPLARDQTADSHQSARRPSGAHGLGDVAPNRVGSTPQGTTEMRCRRQTHGKSAPTLRPCRWPAPGGKRGRSSPSMPIRSAGLVSSAPWYLFFTVPSALVRLHDGDAEAAGAGQGGHAGHPEVCVHHIGADEP